MADDLAPLRRAAAKAAQASQDRDERIRWTYAETGVSIRVIAKAVGLSPARVHQIIHHR